MESVFLLRHRGRNGTETVLGFYSTLSAVEARIENAKWQPAYRECPEGFSLDTYPLDKHFSFKNDSNEPLMLIIEPWASSEHIPPGSTVDIHYPRPIDRDDTSHADHNGDTLVFWCEGPTYEVDIDSVRTPM
jgi:hypothetical protein